MFDALKEEEIVNKVGGRFKLSALIQKRLVALMKGARPLVPTRPGQHPMEIVLEEILQDKIYLHIPALEGEEKPETLETGVVPDVDLDVR